MFKINLMPKLFCPGFRQPMYITVTCRFTAPASNALLTMKRQLLSGILTLRIMAPPTAQRAALKKECRPHTWSVMQASPLNIYKQRFQTISPFPASQHCAAIPDIFCFPTLHSSNDATRFFLSSMPSSSGRPAAFFYPDR